MYFLILHAVLTELVACQGMKLMAVLRACYSFARRISPSVGAPGFIVMALTYAPGHCIARSWRRNRDLVDEHLP
jgi:hypothetical protein